MPRASRKKKIARAKSEKKKSVRPSRGGRKKKTNSGILFAKSELRYGYHGKYCFSASK